ncbi:hypothetical protein KIS1582_4639 [Cytobacillus firmus]|uniref:Uncharacterized protein n=1 Tax=Cytobacillus firmus TaxID=1399 RepID=A0A800MSK7_CYTFI|nr:hypothetical protein KIS1582_4639 [Cytobacillus firmus]
MIVSALKKKACYSNSYKDMFDKNNTLQDIICVSKHSL